MAKDFRLNISVKNDRLLTMIEEKFASQSEMARLCGVSYTSLSALVTMREKPINKSGWTGAAEKIASALGVYPSDIWPEHMRDVKLITRTASISLDSSELQRLTCCESVDVPMLSDLIEKGRSALNKRESQFLDWLLENGLEATYEEKGEVLGVSKPRAAQIEAKMMRKMRDKLKKQHNIASLD